MKIAFRMLTVLIIILSLSSISAAQYREVDEYQGPVLKPGLGFEYLSRRINWDENTRSSNLKAYLFFAGLKFEVRGFLLNLLAGYVSTNYNGLTFRQLPFSIELDVGGKGGYLLGAQTEKSLFSYSDFHLSLYGQLLYVHGLKNSWQVLPLNVTGKLEGRPYWMNLDGGAVFRFTGFDSLTPYLYINYTRLSGKFKLQEKIQDLEGTENKSFFGEGNFGVSAGASYEVSEVFSLRGELRFIPYRNGVDTGFVLYATYNLYWRR
ncbi:MAG: hypothetical protein ACE5LC_03040 [Candidatus Aminicenantales bacterium]